MTKAMINGEEVKGFLGEYKPGYFSDKFKWEMSEEDENRFAKITEAYLRRCKNKPGVKYNDGIGFHKVKLAGYEYVLIEPLPLTIYKDKGKFNKPGDEGFGYNFIADIRKCFVVPRFAEKIMPAFMPGKGKYNKRIVG